MTEKCLNKYANGNFGAMTFMYGLIDISSELSISEVDVIIAVLDRCCSIRGTNLYVLWNDLCGKDYRKVYQLCNNCPNNTLEDACNRQDYSGLELVKQYFI